ncbi:MAG: glycosyltransferase family 2 protein [Firmicutes bacterium]|nr:glycosyltransferase family 2 protein [Bacillota bacterium]
MPLALVDIVVVSFNTRDLLTSCLHSIDRCTTEAHHVIVVDNASTDGTQAWLQTLQGSQLTVIFNAVNRGYAAACNQGIRAGSSPFILLANSDIRMTAGWLAPLLTCMEADEQIAVVGPKLIDLRGRITGAGIVGTLTDHRPRGNHEVDGPAIFGEPEDCFSVCGAAYLIRRTNLETLGYFDERYFFYFEETDYSQNARSRGYRVVYCPDSRIIHIGGRSDGDHVKLRGWFETSRKLFLEKWTQGDDSCGEETLPDDD